jgi:alpha-ketoglutarate-dependent sulfate ester dioxygenase
MTALKSLLDVRKVTARIGAEVSGLDVTQPLSTHAVAEVRAALNEHKALVFADADIDDAGQERFAAHFGPLTTAHPTIAAQAGQPNVLPIDSEQERSNIWHSDVTFIVNPPQASTLRSIVVPPYGGETLIANAGSGYRSLPEPLRAFADTLWAVHTNDYDYAVPPENLDVAARERQAQFTSIRYETVHPVVRVHPLTGERGLFIGAFVDRIVGLSRGESRDVLRLLQNHLTKPENVLTWAWSPRQLVLFDNRITQHYAVDNYDDLPRRLNRVTIAGDIPVNVSSEPSYSLHGDATHYGPVVVV